jgi:transcriptional regulator with XRE-family HTH domain
MNLGNTVTQLREQKGMKQGQLAETLGITQSYLSQIENNKKLPNIALLEKIGSELSTPLPFLFFLSLDENDIPESKRMHFKILDPMIKQFIGELISTNASDKNLASS